MSAAARKLVSYAGRTIAVEGNIASGKTTLLECFKNNPYIQTYLEPVDKWRDVRGHNTLDLMYKDASRWSFTLQSYIQLTMVDNHTRFTNRPVKLLERSIHSAKHCFVENLKQRGLMSDVEYAVVSEWYQWLIENLNCDLDLIVYLKTRPEVVHQRIAARNRSEESNIPLTYLRALHDLHDSWLIEKNFPVPCPVLVIDANGDYDTMQTVYKSVVASTMLRGIADTTKAPRDVLRRRDSAD